MSDMLTHFSPGPLGHVCCPKIHKLGRVDSRNRGKKTRRVPRSGIPRINMSGPERDYFESLKDITDRVQSVLENGMLDGLETRFPDPESTPQERVGAISRITRTFDLFEDRVRDLERQAQEKAIVAGNETQLVHRTQQERQLAAVGIDMFRESPELAATMQSFVRVNTKLIKSIPRDELSRVENVLIDGIREGRRHESVAKDIQAEFGIAKRRAQLIARDQTMKMAADLSRARMESNGVRKGVWRTMGDERVRDSHAAREGRTFDLSRGIQGEWPGGPINCRCYTEPHL